MRKFPSEKQLDTMDCGPVSLKIIAKYYGKNFSLKRLRELTFMSKDGVSLFSISDAAEKLGFKTVGGFINFDQLSKEANLPCIIHWEQNHFVIVYKITHKNTFRKESKIYVSDPAKGLVSYTEKEFKSKWISTKSEGIVLLLEPTKRFYESESDHMSGNSLNVLISYFLKFKKYFGQLIIGLLLGSLFQLIFPFLTQSIVDNGIANKNISFIYLILLAQLILVISRMSVNFIRRWILLHISTRINISLISDFFFKLMRLPMSFFDVKHTGDIMQRIGDHERVEEFITVRSLEIIFSFFSLIIFSVILWVYSFKIFLVFILGSFLYATWILLFLKKRRTLDFKYFEVRSKNQSKIFQLIQGMQEIKLQNSEKRKRWEWEDIQADLYKVNISSLKLEQIQEAGNIFINETKNIIITIIAALAVINNEMTLGMMLATQYIIGQLTLPIEQSVDFIHDFQDTKISLERINEIHKKNNENEEQDKIENTEFTDKDIEINNLTFQYEGPYSNKVLNNLNLSIPYGKVTAIVGTSGSGKTTLIKLLLQYYEPTSGTIKIGNGSLKNINTTKWRNYCGAVMQEGFIFSESIARNIACSDYNIDKVALVKASKIANIHDFIMKLPLKYNTIIGSEGINLSQGQKQRILIARAVYKNPKILIFDEATNALDANNEKAIVSNLQSFYKGKTVVVIAHRLSTVKNSDQIIVLNNGEIEEFGNHQNLISKKGKYYQLVRNQLELGT